MDFQVLFQFQTANILLIHCYSVDKSLLLVDSALVQTFSIHRVWKNIQANKATIPALLVSE